MERQTRIENRVRRFRRVRGLTQQELAGLLGVSRQTVNAIENGRYDPSLSLAFDIAKVFGSRIERIFRPGDSVGPESAWRDSIVTVPDRLDGGPVTLRPHRPSDLPAFQRFVKDPDSTRYMAFTDEQRTSEGAAAMMDAVIESYGTDDPILSLTIADSQTDEYLGAAGAADSGDGVFEVFVTLLPEARGRGNAKAAMLALMRLLFEECGAEKLHADTVTGNTPSMALFEALGFENTGRVHREAAGGALAHREMEGVRFVMTRKTYNEIQDAKRSRNDE